MRGQAGSPDSNGKRDRASGTTRSRENGYAVTTLRQPPFAQRLLSVHLIVLSPPAPLFHSLAATHVHGRSCVEVDKEKLKALREMRVLTLRELSEKSDVTLNTIWRLESGYNKRARPSTIRKLATALGVQPQELLRLGK